MNLILLKRLYYFLDSFPKIFDINLAGNHQIKWQASLMKIKLYQSERFVLLPDQIIRYNLMQACSRKGLLLEIKFISSKYYQVEFIQSKVMQLPFQFY